MSGSFLTSIYGDRVPVPSTHTRSRVGDSPPYCAECSEALQAWQVWPCPFAEDTR